MADKETPQAQAADPTTATAGEQPVTEPANVEAAEAAATEPAPATTVPGNDDPTEKPPGITEAGAAVGVEGYEKAKRKAFEEASAKTELDKDEKWEQAKAAARADSEPIGEDETPAADATEEVPATATTPPPAAAVEETPASATTAGEDEKEPPNRIRIGRLSAKDRALLVAATELADAEGIDVTVAMARITRKPAETAPAAATEVKPAGRSREEIQADITAKKAEKKQAAKDLDTDKMYESDEAIETLRSELSQVEAAEARAEQERQTAEQTKFVKTVADSKKKAIEYWPEANDPNSVLSQRTEELADAYEKDPALARLVSEADSPFYFTQIAAQEMGLAPKHLRKEPPRQSEATTAQPPKPSTPAATKPAPVNQRAVGRPTQPAATPASGGARTTQGGPAADALGLDKIHSPHDYEKAKEKALAIA